MNQVVDQSVKSYHLLTDLYQYKLIKYSKELWQELYSWLELQLPDQINPRIGPIYSVPKKWRQKSNHYNYGISYQN